MFNADTDIDRKDIAIPYIHLPINELVDGKLVTRTYQEAWTIAWAKLSAKEKQQFLDLPNFDAGIFKEITGIEVAAKASCENKVVVIDGKKYKLVETE